MWTNQSLDALHRRCGYAVFRRCRRLLGDEAEAKDVAQEVFLHLIENPDGFQGRAAISTYLYSVATNLCFNRVRNRTARSGEWEQAIAASLAASESGDMEKALESRQLLEALFALTDEVTAAIVLHHYVDGLSQGEIGELVGLSRVTVNQRLAKFRALATAERA